MKKEDQVQIIHKIPTPNGKITHGIQYESGTHKSNIICVLCQTKNKLTTNKTLEKHARHVIREHSDKLGFKKT